MTLKFILTSAMALALAPALFAADNIKLQGQPVGSEMKIDGKATGKTWNCIGKIITGTMEVDEAFMKDPKTSALVGKDKAPACTISIPVRTLKSSGGTIMDKRMQSEMNATTLKNIEFKLKELVSKDATTFDASGDLTIAGTTKAVSFPITVEKTTDGLKFAGKFDTKMSDYKIVPPKFAVAGVGMETADEITLTWTWSTAPVK